jgi:hypothetical protein
MASGGGERRAASGGGAAHLKPEVNGSGSSATTAAPVASAQ